jgi:hypothetical protein
MVVVSGMPPVKDKWGFYTGNKFLQGLKLAPHLHILLREFSPIVFI